MTKKLKAAIKNKRIGWRPISTAPEFPTEVDIWLVIQASPLSFGMSDAFRVTEAYKKHGNWFHRCNGTEEELVSDYITHWMPIPKGPEIVD